MICLCPYSDCRARFEVHGAEFHLSDRFGRCNCTVCQRPCLARPADLIEQLVSKNEHLVGKKEHLVSKKEHLVGKNDLVLPAVAEQSRLVVVLDDIRSLHNVGAVFRTADAAGFSHIYLCGITGVPPRSQITKVSLGAEAWVGHSYHSFLPDVLIPLKSKGYSIIALEKNADSRSLYKVLAAGLLHLPICLVLGNEVSGVSPEALQLADHVCHLKMRGEKESLNASVAFGVAAYFLAEALFD